jgi:hypothetical protein
MVIFPLGYNEYPRGFLIVMYGVTYSKGKLQIQE